MQIFNFKKGNSKQREQQLATEESLQYFFSFDNAKKDNAQAQNQFKSLVKLPNTIDYQLFPEANNELLVRFVNLEDRLDEHQAATLFVNVSAFASQLW